MLFWCVCHSAIFSCTPTHPIWKYPTCVLFHTSIPPNYFCFFSKPFFVCLLTSLSSFCNRHLWYPTYIHVVCLVKKKLIEKITKRFKRWKSQQVWFSLCTVSTNLFFFCFYKPRDTHSMFFWLYVYVYVCLDDSRGVNLVLFFVRIYFARQNLRKRKKKKKLGKIFWK